MCINAVNRSFRVVSYLKSRGEARFGELAEHLAPISHTALSHLLASLVEIGELQHEGRRYSLRPGGIALHAVQRGIYSFPAELRTEIHEILHRTARETMHSCALFGWVGISTMRILDNDNPKDADWRFNPVGYEWPLIPFHGFAQLFLAAAPDPLAKDCYYRWYSCLQEHLRFPSYEEFQRRLRAIRSDGHAIEYRGELPTILRICVPINLAGQVGPRYALGLTANAVHLLEADSALVRLKLAAASLNKVMEGRAPIFRFEEQAELIPMLLKRDPAPVRAIGGGSAR